MHVNHNRDGGPEEYGIAKGNSGRESNSGPPDTKSSAQTSYAMSAPMHVIAVVYYITSIFNLERQILLPLSHAFGFSGMKWNVNTAFYIETGIFKGSISGYLR